MKSSASRSPEAFGEETMGEQWQDLAGHQELMTSRTHSVEVACCVILVE